MNIRHLIQVPKDFIAITLLKSKYIFKMNLSTYQITFLRHVPSDMKVDLTSGWRHHYFDGFTIGEISSFIESIGDDRIYLLIPLFSNAKSLQIATLNLNDFKNLLSKDFIVEKSHEKWIRKLTESKINILEQIYSIKVTDNKRKLIYDKNNKLIRTEAYKINKSKDLSK